VLPSDRLRRRVETSCSRLLPCAINSPSSLVPIGASARLTVCFGCFCGGCGPMAARAGADPASHRRSVAPRRRTRWLAPSLATSRTTARRCTLSRSDSANGRGELSLGRSADPRRIAETRNRRIGTHGLALSARPPATTVTDVAYILRESPRWPYTDLAADVRRCAR
jgi:hypothetical protein